jgi:class 3 adenylate cyclase
VMPLATDLVNLNIIPFDVEPVLAMYESKEAVIGILQENPAGSENAITRFYDFTLQVFYDDPSAKYSGEPVSSIYYPAFDSFDKDRQVVGMLNAAIFWESLFQDILPPNSNGLICVVSNECDGPFTFAIDGDGAHYEGPGDLHKTGYDDFAVVYYVEHATDDNTFSGTAVPLNQDFCPYILTVYPSDQLHQEHFTREPPFFALGVALVFVVVFIVSMTYDCVVQRRMQQIIKTADKNKALVASIFPEGFRQRLFEDGENVVPVFAMGASNKTRLKAMLSGVQDGKPENQDLSFLTAKPVADLFPHCTVLFADISGFSAWSSERQPEQVFTLLETIFQTFDRIARVRHVFKVETIGDSYVAVTGLPEPQPDHAVRMSRFARDCKTKVNSLTKMLEGTLGPDTGELQMRFGLHSGQVTAGVLRGEKSRFQLFGDTVNTAARMESTGLKNRIQMSHSTAQLLIEGGKESWIVPREDVVNAKGKGVVQTYWMIQKESRDDGSIGARAPSFTSQTDSSEELEDVEDMFAADTKDGMWGDQSFSTALPSSRAAKRERLVNWLTDIIAHDLKRVAALRKVTKQGKDQIIDNPEALIKKADMPLEEVVEAFSMPGFNKKAILRPQDIDAIELPTRVREQLHNFVSNISSWYRTNPFHNFEHASHVIMSSVKLLKRIVTPEGIDYSHDDVEQIAADMHTHTFGITSDPLAQFAITFAALIHDVDHMGVPNFQVAKEAPGIGEKYKHQSIAEQNSIDIAWQLLMEPKYKALQGFIFQNEKELKRFRQYLVNMVCATDIFNTDMKAIRNQRWDKAFSAVEYAGTPSLHSGSSQAEADEAMSLKATIVLEHVSTFLFRAPFVRYCAV